MDNSWRETESEKSDKIQYISPVFGWKVFNFIAASKTTEHLHTWKNMEETSSNDYPGKCFSFEVYNRGRWSSWILIGTGDTTNIYIYI